MGPIGGLRARYSTIELFIKLKSNALFNNNNNTFKYELIDHFKEHKGEKIKNMTTSDNINGKYKIYTYR